MHLPIAVLSVSENFVTCALRIYQTWSPSTSFYTQVFYMWRTVISVKGFEQVLLNNRFKWFL